jgi:hypothetical protein
MCDRWLTALAVAVAVVAVVDVAAGLRLWGLSRPKC